MVRQTSADDRETVSTGHNYKQTDTCSLYRSGHRIAAEFDDVLSAFEESFDDDVTAQAVAGGCNGCTTPDDDADVWAYYVAQSQDNIERLYVGFGAADDAPFDAEDVARRLVAVAVEEGVAVDWNGEMHKKVCLGDADAYDH